MFGMFTVGIVLLICAAIGMLGNIFVRSKLLLACSILVGFGAVLFVIAPFVTIWQFNQFVHAYRQGRCTVIEGVVEEFHQMPATGHGLESFEVAGHKFSYSDFHATPGFHQTGFRGGAIRPGITVRIYYLGNDIARLEIANEASNLDSN
jgi:hypothetical protein